MDDDMRLLRRALLRRAQELEKVERSPTAVFVSQTMLEIVGVMQELAEEKLKKREEEIGG